MGKKEKIFGVTNMRKQSDLINAWLGNSILKNDPRAQNKNGKFMEGFLERNELTVLNI